MKRGAHGAQRRSTSIPCRKKKRKRSVSDPDVARVNYLQLQWARHFVEAEVLDVQNVTDVLRGNNYSRCVYECANDIVDHQIVNVEYEGGITASITMSACKSSVYCFQSQYADIVLVTESVCQRGTRIQGTKGELIGDMTTFVSSSPLTDGNFLMFVGCVRFFDAYKLSPCSQTRWRISRRR